MDSPSPKSTERHAGAGPGGAAEFTIGMAFGSTLDLICINTTVESVPMTFSAAYAGYRDVTLTIVSNVGTLMFPPSGIGIAPLGALSSNTILTVAHNNASGSARPATVVPRQALR